MIRRDARGFGQLEPGPLAATEAGGVGGIVGAGSGSGSLPPSLTYFLIAVSAGVTVWFITRALDRRRRSG